MPLNFPDNPQQNDTFTVNGRTYTYRGNRWRRTKARLADVSPTLDVANDFTAGGALHVDSDTGRVGIGTANPQYELHVDGVGEVTGDFQVGQNLDVTGTVDINGLRLTSDGSNISLSEVLAGTYSTQAATTNDDTLATTAFVQSAIANLVDSAPTTLDTLNELAAALGDDPNFATTVTNSIALKLNSSAYTAADVLAKIKTVDGASSGLDADTLDGNHASAFAASSHTHSYASASHTHSYVSTTNNTSLSGDSRNTRGPTRLYRRDSNTDYSVQTYWTGSRWRLYGYIGDSNHADTHVGYADSAGNADTVDGQHAREFSWGHDLNHGAWTNFNSFTNTDNFGAHFVQGTSNGPGQSGASQYYHQRMSLGANYNNYSLQLAIPRNRTDSYLWYRNEENGGVSAWYKIRAGYADTAGYANSSGSTGNADTVDGYHASSFHINSYSNDMTANKAYADDWFRSTGSTGWYSQTYGGGWHMQDTTWLRTYNSKSVYAGTGMFHNSTSNNQTGSLSNFYSTRVNAYFNNTSSGRSTNISLHTTYSTDRGVLIGVWNGEANRVRCLNRINSGYVHVNAAGFTTVSAAFTKERIRTARDENGDGLVDVCPATSNKAFELFQQLRPVIYDDKVKSEEGKWLGCDEHETRDQCADAECWNFFNTISQEHNCEDDDCIGTATDPCPIYLEHYNKLHFLADEVDLVYPHAVSNRSDGTVIGIDHHVLATEHINVTQHLIDAVAELQSRITQLEGAT